MVNERAQPRRIDLTDMSADMIASRRFSLSWRGYDQEEVKKFLAEVAAQVRAWKERCETAEAARREAEQRAAHPQLDETTLMSVLGDETAAILKSARSAATEIVSKAEASAQQLVSEAQSKADEIMARAEGLLAERTKEAEALSAKIVEEARLEADSVRAEARRQHDEMTQAAQEQSEKILADLARKRRLATVQIEQLRAGRERLLEAYKAVRRTLDEVTSELQRADTEARAASQAIAPQEADDTAGDRSYPGEDARVSPSPAGASGPAQAGGTPAKAAGPAAQTSQAPGPVVLRAPKVTEVASEWSALPAGQSEPVVARAAEFERVRIVHEPLSERPAGAHTGDEPPSEGARGPEVASEEADRPGMEAETRGDSQRLTAYEDKPQAKDSFELERLAEDDGPSAPLEEVENLFARIRAGRAAATTKAKKTLGQPDQVREPPTPPMGTPTAGDGPDMFTERDEICSRLESSLARKLKRALQDEQNDLLDRLRNIKGPVVPAKILPSEEEHPDRFVEVSKPLLEEAAQAGFRASTQMFDLSAGTKLDAGSVDDLVEDLGRAVAEPLRQRLEEALRSEGDPGEIADTVGAAYREWKTQRIEAAARDQLAAAWARGAYLALPAGTLLCWAVDPSEGPCPDCEDNALAKAQPKEEPWPTGQLHPPAHPGCRCALVPMGYLGAERLDAPRRGRALRRGARAG
jgi:DivIVA domain-containing protein